MDPRPDPSPPAPVPDATEIIVPPPPIAPVPESGMTSLPEAPSVASPGRNRGRWLIGGGIAVAAVALIALAATLLGARPLPEALKYVPADSAVVIELRPELPGDQRQKVGNFLAHFPGFADQSILETKIDEALARIVQDTTGGAVDYATQIEPLLDGPMVISMSTDGLRDGMLGTAPSGFLVVATPAAGTTCVDVFGATAVGETHRDVDIQTVKVKDHELACATHDRFLLFGDAAGVRGGIDARLDDKGIDLDTTYKAARSSLVYDQLASFFIDGDAINDLISGVADMSGVDVPVTAMAPWTIAGLRVTDDALILEAHPGPFDAPPLPSGAPTSPPAATSQLAGILPADTLAFMEVHGLGALTQQAIAGLRADPSQAATFEQLDESLALVGGMDNLVGWIGDAGFALLPTEDGLGVAVIIKSTDADGAAAKATQIRNLLVLASTGTDITVNDEDHDGVTVTTVDLGDLSTLLGDLSVFGAPAEVGVAPRIKFAFAARGAFLVVAVGDGIMEKILDVDAASSLKSSAAYQRSISLAGPTNSTEVYIAIDSALALMERLIPAEELEQFISDIKPYTDHLSGASLTTTSGPDTGSVRWVLTVK